MTIAYGCVLFIILFPYFFTVLAKTDPRFDNHDPRSYLDKTTGWRRRAHYIQLNSFEALPGFGLAVVISHLANAPQTTLNALAMVFVLARIAYAICYLTDKAFLRSLCWAIGTGCIIGLFYIAW